MATRREFLIKTTAASLAATVAPTYLPAQNAGEAVARIKGATRRDDTILRLGGLCDGYHMSWDENDRQIIAAQDGTGWSNPMKEFNSQIWEVSGGPKEAKFSKMPGYPYINPGADDPRYYGYGTLAADGKIYQYLSTLTPTNDRPWRWIGAKLIYSPDNGQTWHNHDGSTPVKLESWKEQSRGRLVFFREPQESFSLLSFLQMGKNYSANHDGYFYVYGTNGQKDGTMNQLVMFRVPKAGILDRSKYEYFAGHKPDGGANWSKSIGDRAVVCQFPAGWVNKAEYDGELVVESWLPTVTYNAPLDVYMMANTGIGCDASGKWFSKPSYLGFWVAAKPWGPWKQIHEETSWTPGNDKASRAYDLQIAPKWIAPDGKSFWLVWADYQGWDDYLQKSKPIEDEIKQKGMTEERAARSAAVMHTSMFYYAFNTQRFDLVLG